MQEGTRLTIVMPAYNASKYISETIRAIAGQTFAAWKLIVINDCSQDNTAAIVEEWCVEDNRITLLNNDQNLKVARTMNKGIAMVDTPYFARVDSDDVPLPDHFFKIIRFLEQAPDIHICGSQVVTIDSEGNFRRKWNYETSSEWIKQSSIFACPFLQSSVVMRTDVLKASGGYRPEMELVEDYELWVRLLKQYNAANIADYTIRYRIHDNNMSEVNKGKMLLLLRNVYQENAAFYPIDETNLDLHAKMEVGVWEGFKKQDFRLLEKWRKNLLAVSGERDPKDNDLYRSVVSKYFTNAYLKIATQNGGTIRYMALTKALQTSPRYFKDIWKRKRENDLPL